MTTGTYTSTYPATYPDAGTAPSFPTLAVTAEFTPGTLTDITAYVRSGTVVRPCTREQGPLYSFQAGTATLVLVNSDGRFDPDNTSSPYAVNNPTRVITLTGSGTWTAPLGISTAMKVECVGGGSASVANGTGGNGGEYAAEPNLAVLPGQQFTYSVGTGGTTSAAPGGDATFGTVTAHGATSSAGGTGSTNTVHHDGGAGGAGWPATGSGQGGGGGGGGSGGSSSAGNSGGAGALGAAGAGAAAVPGGGPGGNGGAPWQNGDAPSQGPGGGGGGHGYGAAGIAPGADGTITLTYTLSGLFTQILPMVPIAVTATWAGVSYPLFSGYADSWADNGANIPRYAEVTLSATDGQKVLNGITLATIGAIGAGEDTGSRISRILNAAGWSASQRSIDAGDTTLQATTFGDTAWNLMAIAAISEAGELYIDGSGNVVFRHRRAILQDSRSTTPQAVFGDSPGTVESAGAELPYFRVGRANDDTTLANDIQATRVGGVMQEAKDAVSIAQYLYPRTYSRSDLILQDDATVAQWAAWVLYVSDTSEDRFDELDVMPRRSGADLWPQVLGREIGDRIQVWRRPPGVPRAVTKDVFIRGIQHDFDAGAQSWVTTWTLQSASKYGSFFTIGDPTLGRIGYNAIAW